MRCSGSFFLFPKCDIVKNIVAYVKPFQLIFVYIGENTHIERKGFVMDDTQIVDLYFARSEIAIKETDIKYGGYCYKIAYGILANGKIPRRASAIPICPHGTAFRPAGPQGSLHF